MNLVFDHLQAGVATNADAANNGGAEVKRIEIIILGRARAWNGAVGARRLALAGVILGTASRSGLEWLTVSGWGRS